VLRSIRDDASLRASLIASGLETITKRHTCAHRVDELMTILDTLGTDTGVGVAA